MDLFSLVSSPNYFGDVNNDLGAEDQLNQQEKFVSRVLLFYLF